MSTRAQIAIEVGPGEWAHVYSHYDGYPEHMLPALAPWTPEDILAAIEIRQVSAEGIGSPEIGSMLDKRKGDIEALISDLKSA